MSIYSFPLKVKFAFRDERIRGHFKRIYMTNDALWLGWHVSQSQVPVFSDNDTMLWRCKHIKRCLVIPYLTTFLAAARQNPNPGGERNAVWFMLGETDDWRPAAQAEGYDMAGISRIFEYSVHHEFLAYYEEYIEIIKLSANSNIHSLPPPWDFARIIRNAIVHKGTININSPNAPEADWHGLTYGLASNGYEISKDLAISDILILILEMHHTLDQIAPIIE